MFCNIMKTFPLNGKIFIEMDVILIPLLLFIIFAFGWCFIGFSLHNELLLYVNNKYFNKKNILLIIAHPDDESMFFTPLLSYLTHKQFTDKTHILSLSNGGSDTRSNELKSAANKVFGIRHKNIKIINDTENLRDCITLYWDKDIIIKHVNEYINKHDIDIIFTFDNYGISGHPNHISVYNALQYGVDNDLFEIHASNNNAFDGGRVLDIFALKSVRLVRKYWCWLEPMLWLIAFVPMNWNIDNSDIVVLSAPNKCYDGMTYHASQFIWYRKLFVIFTRYAWINQFHKILPRENMENDEDENKKSK